MALREIFYPEFEGVASLAQQKRAFRASFLCENRIFHQFAKFSPSKVSTVRYCLDWLFYAGERVNLAESGCHPRKAGELEGLSLALC